MRLLSKILGVMMIGVVGLTAGVMADDAQAAGSTVVFQGGAENFVFYPGENAWDAVDMFAGLKDALPGDVLIDTIEVRNAASEYDKVRIYLRAEGHDEVNNPLSDEVVASETVASMNDFLAQLMMKVYNGDELIYEGTPDQTGSLTENVLLGDFAQGDKTVLRIELGIPRDLGNEYAHRAGEVDWVFTAEDATETANVVVKKPDTGAGGVFDAVMEWGAILVVVVVVGVIGWGIVKWQKH